MYTHEQKVTHVNNVRIFNMQMNNGFGKHADDLPAKTYWNNGINCAKGEACPHGFQCGGLHPKGSIGMKNYQADNKMSAARCVELFPCCCPVEYLWSDKDMEGYFDCVTHEWVEVGIDHYSTEELKQQVSKVTQAKKEALSDTSNDVTVAPTSRWGSTTAPRVMPDVGQDVAPSRGMGSTQGTGEPKTEEDQVLAAVAAQSLAEQKAAALEKELDATVVERDLAREELAATQKDLEELLPISKQTAEAKEAKKLKKQQDGGFKDAMAAKDAENAHLTTSLTAAHKKIEALTKRCVAAQSLADKACEAAERTVDTLEEIPTNKIPAKIVYVEVVKEVPVEKIVEAPVEEVFDDLKWESDLLVTRLDDIIAEWEEDVLDVNPTLCDEELCGLKVDVASLKKDRDTFRLQIATMKKKATTKIQAAMRGFLVRKALAEAKAEKFWGELIPNAEWTSGITTKAWGAATVWNFVDTMRKEEALLAARNPPSTKIIAALTARVNEEAPENPLLIQLIQLVTQLNATVTDYARRLEILEAERAAGNGQ